MVLHAEYFPSLPWMQTFMQQQLVEIEQYENYQKQGWRNRCRILGAQGPITLSVPLVGGREQKALMKDIRINYDSRWNMEQLRSIKSCYGKAPFFEFYYPQLEQLLTREHNFLLDLNIEIIQLLARWLKWGGELKRTETFELKPLLVPQFPSPIYLQVFSDRMDFVSGLSVLDALFCAGPQVRQLLIK